MSRTHQPAAIPAWIGRFRIHRRLGSGTFGQVYYAWDPRANNREVAVKVPDGHGLSQEGLARFHREAVAAMRMRHPNLCQVIETGEDNGLPFLVMDYIPGESLETILSQMQRRAEPPFSPVEAVRWIYTLALAIHAAHQQGVIHRDLKPGNIVQNQSTNQLVIVDFGMAMLMNTSEQSLRLTLGGHPMGTVLYMPPEQAAGDLRQIGPRSDVYSLGAILYELLCGRTAFSGITPSELMRELMSQDPPPPSRWYSEVPEYTDQICLKAMARKPEDRYRNGLEMADALKRFLDWHGETEVAPVSPGEVIKLRTSTFTQRAQAVSDPHQTQAHGHSLGQADPVAVVPTTQTPPMVFPEFESPLERPLAAETRSPNSLRTTSDLDPFRAARLGRVQPIAWGDLVRATIGLTILSGLCAVLIALAINLGLVLPPDGTPDWLRPASEPVRLRDAQVLDWAFTVGQAHAKIQPINTSGLRDIHRRDDLPNEPYRLVELKLEPSSAVTAKILKEQLRELPQLRKLDLSGCRNLEHLDFLAQLGGLESLDLSQGAYPLPKNPAEAAEATRRTIESITRLPWLRELRLSGSGYPSRLLMRLTKIEQLHLSDSTLEQITPSVCDHLGQVKELKSLDLSGVGLGNSELSKLLESGSLRRLDLGRTAITDEACDRLSKHRNLEALNLSRCRNITGPGVQKLAALTGLMELDLSHLPITDTDLIKLGLLTRLRVLRLNQCQEISVRALRAMQSGLLEELALEGTRMDDELLRDLGTRHAQLQRLRLGGTQIRSLGEVGFYLPPALNQLQLSGASMTRIGLLSLGKTNPDLDVLELSGPELSDELLKEVLRSLPKLAELRLIDCPGVTNQCYDVLKQHPGLKRIQLDRTNMTNEMLQVLRQNRAKCDVSYLLR